MAMTASVVILMALVCDSHPYNSFTLFSVSQDGDDTHTATISFGTTRDLRITAKNQTWAENVPLAHGDVLNIAGQVSTLPCAAAAH